MQEYIPKQTLLTDISALIEQIRATVAAHAKPYGDKVVLANRYHDQHINFAGKTCEIWQTDYISAGDTIALVAFFIELLPLKIPEANLFYVRTVATQDLSAKRLRE